MCQCWLSSHKLDVAKRIASKTGTSIKVEILEGHPAEQIIETIKNFKNNLIVMGSHGRTGTRRLLMGSVTEKVIGHASCPVLVVKS